MENEKVFAMSFSKVYGLLIAKAERKGRTRAEVEEVTFWLTGYTAQQIDELMDSEISYGDFFRQAPAMNPNREKITGVVCGVRVLSCPLCRRIRVGLRCFPAKEAYGNVPVIRIHPLTFGSKSIMKE